MTLHELRHWLRDYGVDDFQQACRFTYNDDFEFHLEATEDFQSVVISAVIGSAAFSSEVNGFRILLQWNYLGIATRGATLSLDEAGERVVLWKSLSLEHFEIEEFESTIGAFLDLVQGFNDQLQLERIGQS